MVTLRVLRALLLIALSAGCGGDTSPADLGGDLAATADLARVPCSDPDPKPGSVCPLDVTGAFATESGQAQSALADRVVSVCAGLCFFGGSDASGVFAVHVDSHIVLADYAFEVHGRPDAATYYAPLPSGTAPALAYTSPLTLPLLPATGTAIPEDAAAHTVSSGGLTLTLLAGTKVQFSVEDFGVDHGHELRVRSFALPTTLPFIDPNKQPAALYALAPFEAAFSQKVALTLNNTAALPAGAAVQVKVMRGLVNDTPPAGRFDDAALAHVSSNGATISTDPGEGIRELTWIALYAL